MTGETIIDKVTGLDQHTPPQLKSYLLALAEKRITLSTMIWGPPGVGK